MHPGWEPATVRFEALIRERLKPGMRVLDLGCGRGGVLEQLGEAASAPLGFDPDVRSLVEHRMPALPRVAATADAIPLAAACVDVIVSSWVLEHLRDPLRVFREVARVLVEGGCFVFLTPGAYSPAALLNRALSPLQTRLVPLVYGRDEGDTFPVIYRANTRRRLEELSREAGLRLESLERIEDPTYLAFNPLLFRLNAALTRVTPQGMSEHLIGVSAKL